MLDHDRVPKAGYQALLEACRPVIVVADRLPAEVRPRRDPRPRRPRRQRPAHPAASGPRCSAELTLARAATGPGTGAARSTADSCVRIGRVEAEVPDDAGELVLDLTLTAGEVTATNRYTTAIAR